MWKTYLYTLDHVQFRTLMSSGESGLAERLMRRHHDGGGTTHEAALDDLEELLRGIEARGNVEQTDDRKTNDLVNHALWLVADEAGVDAQSGGAPTDQYEEAAALFGRGGFLRRPLLDPTSLALFEALHEGRVYGSDEPWESDTRTAILDPTEARRLLVVLTDVAGMKKLGPALQDLLDNHVFPALESAARASMGLLAVTRRI